MTLSRRDVILGLSGAAVFAGCAEAGTQIAQGSAFGSTWRLAARTDARVPLLRDIIARLVHTTDMQMSPYRANSALSRFNRSASCDWCPAPRELSLLAQEALTLASRTDGAFDPTVGPLVQRHGFGPITGGHGPWSQIRARPGALRKERAGLTLDLCGIAKGHALDQIIAAIVATGLSDVLVELGGEVRAIGRHPSGRPWRVAIGDPVRPGVQRVIAPGELALATSGHAVNGLTGPITTSHIIDPRLAAPARPSVLSVSVLAATATQADALATAFCALGASDGIALARKLGASALFVLDDPSFPSEVTTGDFATHLLI